jgi:hypothetical protein
MRRKRGYWVLDVSDGLDQNPPLILGGKYYCLEAAPVLEYFLEQPEKRPRQSYGPASELRGIYAASRLERGA